jgi:hypothetical protein
VDELGFGRSTLGWVTRSPILSSGVDTTSLGILDKCRVFGPSLGAFGQDLGCLTHGYVA